MSWSWPSLRWLALAMTSVFTVAVVIVAQLEYAQKVSVDGWVEPGAKPILVKSDTAAAVVALQVANEDRVQAGQPLLLLDKRSYTADGRAQSQLRLAQLLERRAGLQAARARLEDVHDKEHGLLAERVRSRAEEAASLAGHVRLFDRRVRLAQLHWHRVGQLVDQGWLSRRDAARAENNLLVAQEARLAHDRQIRRARRAASELRADLALQRAKASQQSAQLAQDLAQLEHDIQQARAAQRSVILAPIDGRVTDLVVFAGQRVDAGQQLMTLAPGGAERHSVSLLLPSVAAGRVRPGVPVRVRYSGYPHQEYGSGHGRVKRVSDVADHSVRGALFRTEIEMFSLPEGVTHVPAGMAVQADILLETRALWRWLSGPLVEAAARI